MKTTLPDTAEPQAPASMLARLRRLLARLARRDASTPSQRAGHPAVRRVWREVAPGEWRWTHVDGHTAPK